HLGAVLGDAFRFSLAADHETAGVLQEDKWHAALAAELDEVRTFQSRFRHQNAVVREDPDFESADIGKAANERDAVQRLELVEFASIHKPSDDLTHIVEPAKIRWNDASDIFGIVKRGLCFSPLRLKASVEMVDDPSGDPNRLFVVLCHM